MRTSLAIGLAGLTLLLAHAPARADGEGAPPAKKVENPWKALPKGTVLEFKTTSDVYESFSKKTTHSEASEVWTLLENDGKVATIEVAIGAEKRKIQRDLSPVDEPLQPPDPNATGGVTMRGGPDAKDHPVSAYDHVETPLGTFDCIRVDHEMVMLDGEMHGQDWLVAGFPEPVKWTRVNAGGAGFPTTRTESRTLVRFYVPGSSWRDYAVGFTFDVEVVREHRDLDPPGQPAKTEKLVERWILTRIEDKQATFMVEIARKEKQVERTLPLALAPVPAAEGKHGDGMETTFTTAVLEAIETPLGKLGCRKVSINKSMNEAGGQDDEWRALGYPIAVKSHSVWGHKQQEDVETRTVVKFERPK